MTVSKQSFAITYINVLFLEIPIYLFTISIQGFYILSQAIQICFFS